MDVLANTPAPATSIDACAPDGFSLGGGSVEIGGGSGALLIGGEAFIWRPWDKDGMRLVNKKGQWEVPDPERAFGVFGAVWPRPGKVYFPILARGRRREELAEEMWEG